MPAEALSAICCYWEETPLSILLIFFSKYDKAHCLIDDEHYLLYMQLLNLEYYDYDKH